MFLLRMNSYRKILIKSSRLIQIKRKATLLLTLLGKTILLGVLFE